MPNQLSSTGLLTSTRAELLTYFTSAYESIYGADINLGSDTPDGQMMNINIQAILDLQDLLVQIFNMFDPDNAIGVVLDQRVAINGIQRQAGTFTTTYVTLTITGSVNLYGLDQNTQSVYTVADNAGNQWQLVSTQLAAGSDAYLFQAANPGQVLTVPNTITVPVSIILGVTAINNPTTYSTLGLNEESDAALKIRRQRSVTLSTQGYLAGLVAALLNISGLTFAQVYENVTGSTNGDGVPGHSIWVIVNGGAVADIANAIYTKRNAGCGMYGSQSLAITQVDGSSFTVYWDDVVSENLFITFNVTSLDGVNAPNIAAIRAGLVSSFAPGVSEKVNINEIAALVQGIPNIATGLDSNSLVTGAGFSSGITQVLTLSGTAASGTFQISYNGNLTSTISWNDAVGTIQSKVRSVSGLSAALVTGSIASHTLTFNLGVNNALGLLLVVNNSLATSAPAAITFSYDQGYANTLSPVAKNYQFAISSLNIVILPMILSPVTVTVEHGDTQQFTPLGGYQPNTYAMQSNVSGGNINSSGLYTSGATPGTDVVRVTDALGNTATATITVT